MNFTKLVSIFAFVSLVVLSLGFASASFSFSGVSGGTQTVSAGSQAIISFNVDPSSPTPHTGTLFNATLQLPNLFGTGTSWSGNSLFTVLSTTSVSRTVSVQVPAGQAPGIYTGQISLTGDYVTASGNSNPIPTVHNLSVQITIPSTSSNLSISVGSGAPFTIRQNATLTINNNANIPLTVTMSEPTALGVTFNPSQPFTLGANGGSSTVNAILSGLTNLKFGLHTVTVQATSGNQIATKDFQVKKTFCTSGETLNSNLTIGGIDLNNDGEGDENSWELLDELEIEVEIENNNQDDEIDVVAVLGLFDSNGNDVSDELTFTGDSASDEEEVELSINDGDEETVTWTFKVPADFDSGDYKLAVKAYDEDAGQSRDCKDSSSDLDNQFFESINIEQTSDEGRFIVVDEIELDNQLTCGQTVTGQFTVFNVGDQDQDRVRITIRNSRLNINEVLEITSDLDEGDQETMDFIMQIPANAENGNYGLEFFTEYDYDNGEYDQDGDESFDYGFEVIGCSQNVGNPSPGSLTNLEIDAELDSEAKAGQELVIIATIKNTGTEDATYSLSARGYSSWAELVDISDSTISVDAGESKEVTFTLLVNEDASGTQAFDLQVASDGRTQIQEVEVELSEGMKLPSFGSPIIWVIALVNLVLIILIIVVAVKLSRR